MQQFLKERFVKEISYMQDWQNVCEKALNIALR